MNLQYIKLLCRKLSSAADNYLRHEIETRILIAFNQVQSVEAKDEVEEGVTCPITQRLRAQQDKPKLYHTGHNYPD